MKIKKLILFFIALWLTNSCITQFVPEITEDKDMMVVEGLITDQAVPYTIKLSRSLPLDRKATAKPMKSCTVTIKDNLGNTTALRETAVGGTYVTDPSKFRGIPGRKYTLYVATNATYQNKSYQSAAMLLKPTPEIDSIYWKKVVLGRNEFQNQSIDGAQIYLDTHDGDNKTGFYRWEYSETWQIRLPWPDAINRICWVTNNSGLINVKNTTILAEDKVSHYPITFIDNNTDRLKVKYSILVNQYSLNEDEYIYWEKLQTISEQIGGLYDVTPSAIPSNIYCVQDPGEKVLGYFSVSSVKSKRLFIRDEFHGQKDYYTGCEPDTVYGNRPIQGLNVSIWVLIDNSMDIRNPYRVTTIYRGCADCTTRGTVTQPVFWQ